MCVHQFLGSWRGLHNTQQRIRRETMNESEFQNIVAQNRCKTLTPCITWESVLLPGPGSINNQSRVVEGSGQFVTHPLPSLPPHHHSPIIQVPYEAVNRGGIITLRRHPKMGWNRRLQWNQLSASTPKKSPRDTEGQKASTFLQTFSTSSLSFLFNPQPFYTIVLIFIVGRAICFPLHFWLNIPRSKTVGSIWAY